MIEAISISLVGVIISFTGITSLKRIKDLERKGLFAEGVIFETRNEDAFLNIRIPVVRFLTHANQWVTATSDFLTFPGFYKPGQKVTIQYSEQNPKLFIITSKSNKLLLYTLIIIGIACLLWGIALLISIKS